MVFSKDGMVYSCLLLTAHFGSRYNCSLSSSHPVCNFCHSHLRNKIMECFRNVFWRSSSSTSLIKQADQGLGLKKIKGNFTYKIPGIILYSSSWKQDMVNTMRSTQHTLFLDFPLFLQQQRKDIVTTVGKKPLYRIQFPVPFYFF